MLTRKLSLVYALNLADWICTLTLLQTGSFYEANPLMSPVMGSLWLGFLIKAVLPAVLLYLVWLVCRLLNSTELIWIDRFVSFVMAIYTVICGIHIVDFCIWNFIN